MSTTRHKRRIKLIQPKLQLRLTAIFGGVALTSLLLQFLLFMQMYSDLAMRLPNDALLVLSEMRGELMGVLAFSVLVLLPLTFSVGVLVTFRIAGPVYRLERYLEQVARGEKPADCALRQGDELQTLCKLVNEATRPLREGEAEPLATESSVTEESVAA
ncbi:hypothetical protein [Engelhardtia mirabilis]|uniref:HAMP domain-containing protein n=1 Tax=Engelhardtia mirabilis TaxID=2528011 RepID=A0A518BEX9_9BACT|nr:hypothetical protein Pla133_05810 [Planctomycetes bacterium Pla133]QDU99842.1 hypothetical protein Pla86_05810 [Planctomycetes bacterium Pla86]